MSSQSDGPDPIVALAMALQSAPGRFALLLGSGVSRSAGIPTGWAVVSDLAGRVAVADGGQSEVPSDPVAWYESRYGGSPEYSGLLAAVAPTSALRRELLASYFEPTVEDRDNGRKVPTKAHRAIARLVARGTVRVILTTNFDRLLEQAIQAEGVEPVVVATAAAAQGTIPLAHTTCTVIKVHGDYLDPNIKNTVGELAAYEEPLDALLDRAFDDYGLLVCGWSGTWDPALRNAIERCPTRRYGLYWAAQAGLTPEATRLVQNRSGAVIAIQGADEFFEELLGKVEALDDLGRASAMSVEISVAEAKRYLPDPVHRIRLVDLANRAADRALAEIDFDGYPASPGAESYLAKAARVEEAAAEVMAVLAVVSQFGDRLEHSAVIQRVLARLATPSGRPGDGSNSWLSLRRYPGLLGLYACGLGAIANDNWESLASAVIAPVPDTRLNGDGEMVPFPKVFTWLNVLDGSYLQAAYETPRRVVASDYLYDQLRGIVGNTVLGMTDDQFAVLFDEWEYVYGVVTEGLTGSGVIGRFVYGYDYILRGRTPERALRASVTSLATGRLFDGRPVRAFEVQDAFNERVRESGLSY